LFLPLHLLQIVLAFVDSAFFQHLTPRNFTNFMSSPRHRPMSLIPLLVHSNFVLFKWGKVLSLHV
jgi:hypothetical protein